MKYLAPCLLLASVYFAGITGCSSDGSSDLNALDQAGGVSSSKPSMNKTILFSRDNRQADGSLVEIAVASNSAGGFDITRRSAHTDRRAGTQVDDTKSIVRGASCSITDTLVSCQKDMRMVDGPLTEVTIEQGSNSNYSAVLKVTTQSRAAGGTKTETTRLGDNLTRSTGRTQPVADQPEPDPIAEE